MRCKCVTNIFSIDRTNVENVKKCHTICLIAISKDFFESDLPNPEVSGDEDDLPERLWEEFVPSSLGGANFRIFTTLSTILVPITTGLTLSFALEYPRLTAGIELPVG